MGILQVIALHAPQGARFVSGSLEVEDWGHTWLMFKTRSPNIMEQVISGTFYHAWWTCPSVHTFWAWVFGCVDMLFSSPHSPDPKTALLSQKPDNLTIVPHKLAPHLVTAPTQKIEKAWKTPPTEGREGKSLHAFLLSKRKIDSYITIDCPIFEKIWSPLICQFLL